VIRLGRYPVVRDNDSAFDTATAHPFSGAPTRVRQWSITTSTERLAEVEILFRAGNARMTAWPENEERAQRGETLLVLCECARLRCRKWIPVAGPEYEAVPAEPMLFMVAPGHDFPESERVIEERDGYVIVQKNEGVRVLVELMDLRRSEDP
jgi:hypothetical protein